MGTTIVRIMLRLMALGRGAEALSELEPTHVGHGVYFEKRKDFIAYEGSIPLIFFLPGPPRAQAMHRGYKWTNCQSHSHTGPCDFMAGLQPFLDEAFNMKETLTKSMFGTTEPMFKYVNDTVPASKRVKRNRVGDWLHDCCDVATLTDIASLQITDGAFLNFMKRLKTSVTTGHQSLFKVETEVSELSNKTVSSVHHMRTALEKLSGGIATMMTKYSSKWVETFFLHMTIIAVDLLSLAHSQTLLSSFEHLQNFCNNKMIPPAFIPPELLQKNLEKVKNELQLHGKTLAISNDRFSEYYKLPIVSCQNVEDRVVVKVQIPFTGVNNRWEILRTHPVPFAYEKSTLVFDLPSQLIARSGLEIRIFESLDESSCGNIHGSLCLIPKHTSQNVIARRCLKVLLGVPTVSDIRSACKYTNLNSTLPHVTRLENNVYSVAHIPKGASIQCIRKEAKTTTAVPGTPTFGNTDIRLPCECSLMAAGEILAAPPFPCPGLSVTDPVLRTVVPIDWTDIEHLPTPPADLEESQPMGNLSRSLAPMIKDLRAIEEAPMELENDAEVNITDSMLDSPDTQQEVFLFHNWIGSQFDVTNALLWAIVFINTAFITVLMWDYGRRLLPVAATYSVVESIPLAEGIPIGYTPCYCAFPVHFDVLLYLAVGMLILIIGPKILSFLKKAVTIIIRRLVAPRSDLPAAARPLVASSYGIELKNRNELDHVFKQVTEPLGVSKASGPRQSGSGQR